MKQFNNRFPHFPHISRRITAFIRRSLLDRRSSNEGGGEGGTILYITVGKFAVLGLLVFFLATLLIYQPSGFDQAKSAVMFSPNDLSSHLLLAQQYLAQGNMEAVERELTLAESLSRRPASSFSLPASSVLGASLSPLKILEKIKAEPQRINQEISFWEKVIAEKPGFRDAYLQLAVLNYQIYETQKAKAYLEKAKALDPNFEAAKKLEELLKTF